MRKPLLVVASFLPVLCLGQVLDHVVLKWKLQPTENLSYLLVNTKTIYAVNSTDSSNQSIDAKDLFYGPKESYSGSDSILCHMSPKGYSIIGINWVTYNASVGPTGVDTSTAFMWRRSTPGDTVLRGSIYETGIIHSFYSTQRDYLAFYFQLPNQSIKVGDSWPVDFNVISFDNGFICDSSFKLNTVTLSDILVTNTDTVATISYDLIEYASGIFSAPMFGTRNVRMEFRHKATAKFSINRGRWLSYQGTQTTETAGIMNSKTVSEILLMPR